MAGRTSLLPRLLALGICLASIGAIAWIARTAPPAATVAAGDGDCAARKRAEIEAEKAAGRLTAEQAMIRRQKIRAECG